MKLSKLYIENFMCHEASYIDFNQFSSALIVGKVDNNDNFSNGVGKSTIFKAIEYVLFNQADVNLEKIIRDDAASCKITIDFLDNGQEYRLCRLRTKKGTTDVSLYKRNSVEGLEEQVYHVTDKPIFDTKFWQDISSRRAADTEKDIAKLLKINFKSFRSTVHFMQNDFSGLTTATPEKRKGILKEALNLAIYSKLEKIAKEKSSLLSKEIDKTTVLLESLKDPAQDIIDLKNKLQSLDIELATKQEQLTPVTNQLNVFNENLSQLVSNYKLLESKFNNLLEKQKSSLKDKQKIENSIKDYDVKKSNIINSANAIIAEIKSLKEEKSNLELLDMSNIDKNNKDILDKKEKVSEFNNEIKISLSRILELKTPLPNGNTCDYCRQPLSHQYKKDCQEKITLEISNLEVKVANLKKDINNLNLEVNKLQQEANYLTASKQKLEKTLEKISSKNQELLDKKSLHAEYVSSLNTLQADLKIKINELDEINIELQNSSREEAEKINVLIEEEKKKISEINSKISLLNKEIAHLNSSKAVVQHNIDQKVKDLTKKQDLDKYLLDLNKKYKIYPSVLQAFSSTGIPNLFIQNVLDDLQIESNALLEQLKPGLQLSFLIEKTKSDGTDSDTLEINYYLNGKERQYDQLSGAQKLAVTFSLKLGLSFLLQKMIGTDIKFLLLDEIDQSLDKAGVDAFADIVKFFQKDFTILVITHNDRLKDKFTNGILVEQDINMISRAKVVSSW
jgi:DNA repair exonuclease SbcCD ATPase subunit